jgi:putative membrane protein
MGSSEALNAPESYDALLGALIGACAVLVASIPALTLLQLGPISGHMAVHIASMNVVAPFAAIVLALRFGNRLADVLGKALWSAALIQMGLLWALHSPPIHHVAHSSTTAFAALHAALFLSAVAFWTSVLVTPLRWQAMLALLLNGKFACLLGALLIFAPRVLLPASPAHGSHAMSLDPYALADQHLAGLLMVAACPLSYVLAAIVLAAKTMTGLEKVPAPAFQALRR